MRRRIGAKSDETIRKQAGQDMVILLQDWKRRLRRLKIYRFCLCAVLAVSCTALACTLYYRIDSNIPSVLNVRADKEQSFFLGVPAQAQIVSVSETGTSNIPAGAVHIDLSKPVTMKAPGESSYRMSVRLFGFLPIKQVDIHLLILNDLNIDLLSPRQAGGYSGH